MKQKYDIILEECRSKFVPANDVNREIYYIKKYGVVMILYFNNGHPTFLLGDILTNGPENTFSSKDIMFGVYPIPIFYNRSEQNYLAKTIIGDIDISYNQLVTGSRFVRDFEVCLNLLSIEAFKQAQEVKQYLKLRAIYG